MAGVEVKRGACRTRHGLLSPRNGPRARLLSDGRNDGCSTRRSPGSWHSEHMKPIAGKTERSADSYVLERSDGDRP